MARSAVLALLLLAVLAGISCQSVGYGVRPSAGVMACAGRVIDDPAEVGGWPELRSGPVPAVADDDGMPDEWEVAHGSDPRAFDAWQDADGNGWSDLEDYLNQRADTPAPPLG